VQTLAAALLALVVLLAAGGAAAEAQRIVVLQPDDELFRAISLSLSPWNVESTRSDALPPHASQPEAVERASQLARELRVQAVVWTSRAERGSVLWVFDARGGGITTRMLAETPPFDSAAAAAVALSVKTMLRSSVVAPPAERFGARPAAPPPEALPSERALALELGAGAGWIADRGAGLALDLAALAWLNRTRRLGVSVEFVFGPSLPIENESYRGSYRELVTRAKASWRWIHGPRVSAQLSLGGALHWGKLEGTLVVSSSERSVRRMNPSLDAGTSLNLYVSSATYLGASLGVGYVPAQQRYLVEGRPIFTSSPLSLGLGGHFGVELF
jgi:hypothetical protein